MDVKLTCTHNAPTATCRIPGNAFVLKFNCSFALDFGIMYNDGDRLANRLIHLHLGNRGSDVKHGYMRKLILDQCTDGSGRC